MTTQNIFDLVDTWNDGATTFTAVKMNVTDTASAAASLLMDLQVGAASRFRVGKDSRLFINNSTAVTTLAPSGFVTINPSGSGAIRFSSEFSAFNVQMGGGSTILSASANVLIAGGGLRINGNTSGTGPNVDLGASAAANLRLGSIDVGATTATVTITIAAPGVVTWGSHGLSTGTPVVFTTTGALPTGITSGTTYYVVAVDTNTFQLASSVANAIAATPTVITTSGSQSGTHTGTRYNITQRLSMQSVTGVTDRFGADLFIQGSQGTGTGAGGSIIFQVAPAGGSGTAQNALAAALTINSASVATFASSITVATSINLGHNAGFGLYLGNSGITGGSNWTHFVSNTQPFSLGTGNNVSYTGLNLGQKALHFNTGTVNNLAIGLDSSNNPVISSNTNTLDFRNGTAAQRFNVYNTWTSSTNYEAFKIDWITTANTVLVGTEKGSVGGTARDLEFQRDGTTQIVLANGETRIGAGASPLITFGQSSASTSARFGFYGGAQLVNSTVSGAVSLRLTNGSLNDFGALQFGGTTSSFPALKRNATALETKLADDSAYAPHAMQYLDVTDGVTAPASATGRARIYVDTADGDLKVIFADGTVKTIVTDT